MDFWFNLNQYSPFIDFDSILARMSCSINSVMILIAWFNIPEFLFYMAIYKHEKRYVIMVTLFLSILKIVNYRFGELVGIYRSTYYFQIKWAAPEIYWSDYVGSKKEKQNQMWSEWWTNEQWPLAFGCKKDFCMSRKGKFCKGWKNEEN